MAASYEIEEMREQALKAARYFERGLERHRQGFVAFRDGDAVIVAARGLAGARLSQMVEEGVLGRVAVGVEDVPEIKEGAEIETAVGWENVTVERRYHAPPMARGGFGNVHLHVSADMRAGRRFRRAGEALCAKRRGTDERMEIPAGAKDCGECARIAAAMGAPVAEAA